MVHTALLLVRRNVRLIGGELGGPSIKYPCAAFLGALWLLYVLLSGLESYCVINVPFLE